MKETTRLAAAFWLAIAGAAPSAQTLESAVPPADTASLPSSAASIEAPAMADSADEYNFLELFYYGPDDDYYEGYDLWDLLPDREGDSRDSEPEERDSQERDARD